MPVEDYHYRAIDAQNRLERGVLTTHHVDELQRHLQKNGLILLDYRIKKPKNFRLFSQYNSQELIEFCFYLQQLLQAGLPLIDSLQQLKTATTNKYFQNIINHLIKSMDAGECLSAAMRQFPQVFDKVFIQLIQVGEQAGQLPTVLEHLTEMLTWKQDIRRALIKALFYPAILLVFVVGVVAFVLYGLVPQMLTFLEGFAINLPWYTQWLVSASDWMAIYGFNLFISVLSILISCIVLIRFHPYARCLWGALLLKTWVIGSIIEQLLLARFSRFFALMYQSGLPILDVLHLLRGTLGNCVLEKALIRAHTYIVAGDSITEGFKKTQLFSSLTLRMLNVGETTGSLDTTLYHVSDFYQKKAQYRLEQLHAILEPLLIILLAAILAAVMLSVLNPIYSVIGAVKF